MAKLDRWIELAATAASVHEMVGEKPSRAPARRKTVSRPRAAGAPR